MPPKTWKSNTKIMIVNADFTYYITGTKGTRCNIIRVDTKRFHDQFENYHENTSKCIYAKTNTKDYTSKRRVHWDLP